MFKEREERIPSIGTGIGVMDEKGRILKRARGRKC